MAVTLVTGADRGIANAICRQLAARGDRVIAACLVDAPELRALGMQVEQNVDVTSDSAVGDMAKRLTAMGALADPEASRDRARQIRVEPEEILVPQ